MERLIFCGEGVVILEKQSKRVPTKGKRESKKETKGSSLGPKKKIKKKKAASKKGKRSYADDGLCEAICKNGEPCRSSIGKSRYKYCNRHGK